MNKPSVRRLAENQVVFRHWNERVQKGFDEIQQIAAEENSPPVEPYNGKLYFYCECSDEDCRERISVKVSTYNKIHEARDRFSIVCGHEVPSIEKVVTRTPEYCVVEKFIQPPQTADRLNPTSLHNA